MNTGGRRLDASGFTLIELMIVVAIAAILAAVAVTSYQSSVIKSRRGAAAACLLEGAQYMERVYTTKMSYSSVAAIPAAQCQTDLVDHYTIAPVAGSVKDREYRISATPKGNQASKDAKCGTLSIDQLGRKSVSGTAPVKDCW